MFDLLTPKLIQLTSEVGEVIMSFYKSDINVETKGDETPLTIVDQQAHQLISSGLELLTPDIPILSEESEDLSYETRSKWDDYWLIDPLDGTRDFIEQTGEFCICIAYIRNNRPIFGFVYAPLSKTHYYTDDQLRTFKLHQGKTTLLKTPLQNLPLEVVIGRHSFNNKKLQSHLKKIGDANINHLGSALKFCKIAEGLYDYYPRFGPCSEWDTAAGSFILQCAGGSVVDESGNALSYNTKQDLLSPVFFASSKP